MLIVEGHLKSTFHLNAAAGRYMPGKEGPFHLRPENELSDEPPLDAETGDWRMPVLPVGLMREFQVGSDSRHTVNGFMLESTFKLDLGNQIDDAQFQNFGLCRRHFRHATWRAHQHVRCDEPSSCAHQMESPNAHSIPAARVREPAGAACMQVPKLVSFPADSKVQRSQRLGSPQIQTYFEPQAFEPRRYAQILKVPEDISYNGRGPLVSARLVDLDMMWTRAEQVGLFAHLHLGKSAAECSNTSTNQENAATNRDVSLLNASTTCSVRRMSHAVRIVGSSSSYVSTRLGRGAGAAGERGGKGKSAGTDKPSPARTIQP